jgi:hypothetical protein
MIRINKNNEERGRKGKGKASREEGKEGKGERKEEIY